MKKLLTLVCLVTLSIALFVAVFSVVHRPLVVGEIQKSLDYKLAYARELPSPKIVLLAGSNGRYSHRCEVLTARLNKPCVNASIGVGIGLDFLLDQWRPVLRRGDIVYMPLEYGQYRFTQAEMHGGLQNALMVHSQRDYLLSLDAERITAAYGSFDLPFLIHGLAEMALDHRGFRRRSSTDSLTPQGDESGHTAQRSQAYASFLRGSAAESAQVPVTSDVIRVIDSFLQQARRDGILVVGGLPTVPDSVTVEAADVERLRSLYESRGQAFVALPNRSRYPIDCFFDTLYHLNEGCQKAHSAAVAAQLASLLWTHPYHAH
ncbi:MAG: hypothetical protein IV105_01620 [Rhizobacter sp.]|nr:hypothetical protein [Rhizobacter sp.]